MAISQLQGEWGYQQYGAAAQGYAAQYGVPWPVFASLIQQESQWNPNPPGYNDGGQAVGFGQLHSAAAIDGGITPDQRKDPDLNLKASAAYLSSLYKQTGDWGKAAAAYNDGIGNLGSAKGTTYANSVISRAKSYGWDGTSSDLSNAQASYTGTGGQTGSEYTDQQKQNAAKGLFGLIGGDTDTSGTPSTSTVTAPSGGLFDLFSSALSGLGALAGAMGGAAQGGAQTLNTGAAGLPASVGSLLDNVNELFTAAFWQNLAPYALIAVAALVLIVVGVVATSRSSLKLVKS